MRTPPHPLCAQELETLVTYLGLDLSQEEVDHFVESRHGHDVLSFMNQFVHKIDKVSGLWLVFC